MTSRVKATLLLAGADPAGLAEGAVRTMALLACMGELDCVVAAPREVAHLTRHVPGISFVELCAGTGSDAVASSAEAIADDSDLVHAVGLRAAALAEAAMAESWRRPLVVTADGIPTRRRRLFLPGGVRHPLRVDCWLVHGRSAAARLARSGGASGSLVVSLPPMPMTMLDTDEWRASRVQARSRLGVRPGVLVVMGTGPASSRSCLRMRSALGRLGGLSVRAVWLDSASPQAGANRSGEFVVVGAQAARDLVPAIDVAVGLGGGWTARTPAVDAAFAGLPVVATTDDIAADLVLDGATGRLTTPRDLPAAIEAVSSPRRRPSFSAAGGTASALPATLKATAHAYVGALGRPLRRSDLLVGRTAS